MGKKKSGTKKTVKVKEKNGQKAKAEKPEKPKAEAKPTQKPGKDELEALRKPVEVAKASLEKAREEAKALTEKARTIVADAKHAYHTALIPYREACKKARSSVNSQAAASPIRARG